MKNFLRRNKRLIAFVVALSFVFTTVIPENYSMVFASEISEDATSGDAIEIASSEDATINSEADVEGEAEAEEVEEEDDGIRTLYADLRESGCSITVNATSESLPYPKDELSLSVRELEEGSIEYYAYLSDAAKELGEESTDDISFARFFDIEILYNGEKVEPESPVEVKIDYDEAPEIPDGAEMNIVHFGDEGTEVINDVQLSKDASEISYDQESFSITSTIVVNPESSNKGHDYVLVATYNNKVYTVQNDGSLKELSSSDYAVDGIGNVTEVTEKTSFMWKYIKIGQNDYLRYASDGFAYDQNDKYATVFSYTSIYPDNDNGLLNSVPEYIKDEWKTVIYEDGHVKYDNYPEIATIEYVDGEIKSASTGKFLSIDATNNVLKGNVANSDDGVKFYFAKSSLKDEDELSPYADFSRNHVVNHIDISISDKISATIPIAYGTYYDSNHKPVLTITKADYPKGYSLNVTQEVHVSQEHLRSAELSAHVKNADGSAGAEIDDAFYVTGFSANAETELSTPQVRIEGIFKVANIAPVTGDPNSATVCQDRLDNKILYTVKAVEPDAKFYYIRPNYTPTSEDDPDQYLYDMHGNKLYAETDVTVERSFDYFDEDNECPPLKQAKYYPGGEREDQKTYEEEWQSGAIHPYGYTGMDFVLKGQSSQILKPYAIEIENKLISTNDEPIIPKNNVTIPVGVYSYPQDDSNSVIGMNVDGYNGTDPDLTSYSWLNDKDTVISNDPTDKGTALVYEYGPNIPEGMIYVKEDKDEVPNTIVDVNDQIWVYKKTYIETEYVWRENDSNNGKTHYSKDYTKSDSDYSSMPEVVGTYGNEFNGFLEFYVRNVYEKVDPPTKEETLPYTGSGDLGAIRHNEIIYYKISYKNYNTTASTVYIEDVLDNNVEFVNASDNGACQNGIVNWTINNVPSGATGEVSLYVRLLDSAFKSNGGPGKIINGGSSTTVRVNNDPAQTTNTVENIVPEPPIKREISPYYGIGNLGGVNVDDTITYEIDYKNYKSTAQKIEIIDKLDDYVTYVSSSNNGTYDSRNHIVTWSLDNIAANTTGKVTLTVKVKESALKSNGGEGNVINGYDPTRYTNQSYCYVFVGSDVGIETNNIVNPVPKTSEKTEISPYQGKGELGAVEVGDKITYRIDYENYQTGVCDIKISDKLDANVEYVEASCENGDTVDYDSGTHTVNWVLKDRNPGDKGYVTLTVKVLEGACKSNGGPGEVINGGSTATVQVGNDNAYSLDEVKNPVTDPKTPDKPEDPKDPEKTGGDDSSSSSTPKDPEKKETKVTSPPDASGSANSTPSKSTAKTGDTAPFIPVIIVMILSGVCIAALFIIKRRKKRQA